MVTSDTLMLYSMLSCYSVHVTHGPFEIIIRINAKQYIKNNFLVYKILQKIGMLVLLECRHKLAYKCLQLYLICI